MNSSIFYFSILLTIGCDSVSTQVVKKDSPNNIQVQNATVIDTTLQIEFDSMIRSIFEDSKGNYWFGSDQEGVCKFDGKSFTYFTMKDGLSNHQIRTIQEDKAGNIWFATGDGICSYNGNKITTHRAKNYKYMGYEPIDKWKKQANDLWFNGENEGGIYRYDGENVTVLKFPILEKSHPSFSISGTVTGISEGKNNMLWMANYAGVIGFNGTTFSYINQKHLNYHVRSLLADSKGNLWIGNNGIGVLLYDGDKTTNFTEKMGLNDTNGQIGGTRSPIGTLNHVFSIEEDIYGNIWFGDRDSGVWSFDGNSMTNYTKENGLTSNFARVIYSDKQGVIWIGLEGGDLFKFNGSSFDKMF